MTVSQLTCTGYLLFVVCLGQYGCAVALPSSPTSHTARAEGRCAPPPASSRVTDVALTTAEHPADPPDTELPFSRDTMEVAKAMAVLRKREPVATLELFQLHQELTIAYS